MKLKNLKNVKLAGKTVLLRVDFNAPLVKGKVADDFKLVQSLPTIKFLLKQKCAVVVATHLGEPKARDAKLSTKPLATALAKLLHRQVIWLNEIVGSKVELAINKLKPGQVLMLENLRFDPGEIANDPKFAKKLAGLADIYVNDAFAVCHRAHASVSAITKYLPSYAGLLLTDELANLNKALKPVKPLVVIIGGAKIESKINLLKNLSQRADYVLLGGALANSFLAAKGYAIGKSLNTLEGTKAAKKLLTPKIILPIDVVVSDGKKVRVRAVNAVGKKEMILDIGPETMKLYARYIKTAATLIWNGPMGKFEEVKFRQGTLFIARMVALRSSGKAFGLVGGGETVEALKLTKMMSYVDWVSTGGGATLAYLGGEKMAGLE